MTFTRSITVEPGQPYEYARAAVDVSDLDGTHKAIFDAGATAARYLVETESGIPTKSGAVVGITGWHHEPSDALGLHGSIGLNISISLPPAVANIVYAGGEFPNSRFASSMPSSLERPAAVQ